MTTPTEGGAPAATPTPTPSQAPTEGAPEGNGTPATPEGTTEGTPPAADQQKPAEGAEGDKPKEPTQEQVEQVQAMDFTDFSKEFDETGDISADNRTKLVDMLKDVGISEDYVNAYLDGQKALKAQQEAAQAEGDAEAFASFGGKEAAQQMVDWAVENLPEAEINRYTGALQGDDVEKAELALEAIRAKYEAAGNKTEAAPQKQQPKLKTGGADAPTPNGGDNGPGSGPYANEAEMRVAIRDPRYKRDKAYRDAVVARVLASD